MTSRARARAQAQVAEARRRAAARWRPRRPLSGAASAACRLLPHPDFTPRSANKSLRGQMAEKMSGKHKTETGADATARHVHVRWGKAGSLVMEIFWRARPTRGHRRGARGGRLRYGRHRAVRGEDLEHRDPQAPHGKGMAEEGSGSARRPTAERSTPSRPSS